MNARTMILLAAGALLAGRAAAEGQGDAQQPQSPPSDKSQSWYQKDAQKARELGQRGGDAAKKGASAAGRKVNEGGQAAAAKVVGTKTVTGRVAGVSKERVTVERSDGAPLDMRLTDSTKVTVGGKKASIGSLREGDEVRASYAQSGGAATARSIEVQRTKGAKGSTGSANGGGTSGSR